MKRFLLITLIILSFLTGMVFAQDWEIVKQGDLTESVINGFFLDASTGWIILNDDVILKTTDGGTTWDVVKETDSTGVDWNDIEFANADVGYACTDDGFIYKTTDGGSTWTEIESGNYTGDFEGVSVVDENMVYVCGDDSLLLKTTDGGSNFTKMTYDFQGEDLDGGVAFIDANVGVVISDGNTGSTWYTHDGGDTWEFVQLTFPPGTLSKRLYAVSGAGDSTFVVSGYHYCNFVSTDGGKTYTLSGDYTYDFQRFTSVDMVDENIFISGGSDGQVRKTIDGGATWDTLQVGTGQTVEFVSFIDENNGYVILNEGQWMKTTDGGASFTPLRDWPGVSFWGLALPEDDKIVLTAWGGGEMTMSTDAGMTWEYPTNYGSGTAENIYECEFIDENNGLFGGGSGFMKRTSDGGQTWTLVDNPMYQGSRLHINSLRYVNENFVLAGGSKGSIMKSMDGGQTWEMLPNDESKTVYDIFPISDTQVIASASSGQIYLSTAAVDSFYLAKDYGSNLMRAVEFRGDVGLVVASKGVIFRTTVAEWDTLEEVFTEPDGDDFYDVEFISDSLVYAVGENGKIYMSEDAGLTWTQEAHLTESTLQKVRYRNHKLWAVGQEGTILKLDMTPQAIDYDENQVASTYDLSQNYPNPFNPTTTIEFAIKKAGKVNLSVYNVAGQKVATLINQKMNAGQGAVTFDATGFASGVYFYQITVGDFKQVKKMLLVK